MLSEMFAKLNNKNNNEHLFKPRHGAEHLVYAIQYNLNLMEMGERDYSEGWKADRHQGTQLAVCCQNPKLPIDKALVYDK